MSDDFWKSLEGSLGGTQSQILDAQLSRISSTHRSLQDITDRGRRETAVPVSLGAGTRVAFKAYNLGVVLTYPKIPAKGVQGEVISVRTSSGDRTAVGDHLFVHWDDGNTFPVHREHLKVVEASATQKTASSLGDLTDYLRVTASDTDLVHKATKDLWALKVGEDGGYVIERLFEDVGEPLKV